MMRVWLCCLIWMATPVLAAAPQKALESTQKALEKTTRESRALAAEANALEEEHQQLQKRVVALAEDLQHKERSLLASERALAGLRASIQAKETEIVARKQRLSGYTHVLLRIQDVPPEALLLVPELGQEQIEAATALAMVTAHVREETRALQSDLAVLRTAEVAEAKARASIRALVGTQKEGQEALAAQLRARAQAYAAVDEARVAKETQVKTLAKEAASLKELLQKLQAEEKITARTQVQKNHSKKARSFASAKGHIRLPAAGSVAKRFGQMSARGDRGVLIETRSRATVTAPFDGEVAFTGPFMNYGPIVIIRHRDHFLTLLAGLDTIHTRPGEFLLEGEPIGAMGDEAAPGLYLELRKGAQPIDPAAWVAGL